MASYQKSEEVKTRTVYRVPKPAPYVEVLKAIQAAVDSLENSHKTIFDDTIVVESDEENILVVLESSWRSK